MGGVGTGINPSVGPMQNTQGGTSSNDISRDVNEQGGGQVIQGSRMNPPGQKGHAQGGDYSGIAIPRAGRGVEHGQSSLPTGELAERPDAARAARWTGQATGRQQGTEITMTSHNHRRSLPADLSAPSMVGEWRRIALPIAGVFSVLSPSSAPSWTPASFCALT